jgi:hypothetical protein
MKSQPKSQPPGQNYKLELVDLSHAPVGMELASSLHGLRTDKNIKPKAVNRK